MLRRIVVQMLFFFKLQTRSSCNNAHFSSDPIFFLHMQQTAAAVERVFSFPSLSMCITLPRPAALGGKLRCAYMQKTPNGLAVAERAHQIKRGRRREESAASTKIVVLAVMQYLKENHRKVVLVVVRAANGKRKWRWSFSHFDKRSHNDVS